MDAFDNNSEQSYTTRVGEHEPCIFSIVAKTQLTDIRQKNTFYRGKDCMEKYCKKLKEWVMKMVNYKMEDIIPLTKGQKKYHEKQNKCHICDKGFLL